MTRTKRATQSGLNLSLSSLMLCGLLLCKLPNLQAREEGDACTLKHNLAGVCMVTSECENVINKYIKSGRLTTNDIPSCGFGLHEEIICCPAVECCPDESGPSQVTATTPKSITTTTTIATNTTTSGAVIPTPISNTVEDNSTSSLNEESPYFDFQQLLKPNKPQPKPQSKPQFIPQPIPQTIPQTQAPLNPNTHESIREQPRFGIPTTQPPQSNWQSMGPFGEAPVMSRQPKIINRPHTFRPQQRPGRGPASRPIPEPGTHQPLDLIQLVNEQLRQQGMNIVPANQVNSFELPSVSRTTSTVRPPTIATVPSVDLDPWAPFRFRDKPVDNAELTGPETTTTEKVIQATPTTRVDVPNDRPAARACQNIQKGYEGYSLTTHILDGIPVEAGTYPHMAAIAFSTFGTFTYGCGGSLISSRHVLTAAHCVNNESPVHVRLGTVNIDQVDKNYQDIAITDKITIHPEYTSSSKYNDIAILELAEEAKLSHYIYPACLETSILDPDARALIFVAGWGIMNTTTRKTSKILLRAPLTVIPVQQCNEAVAEQPGGKRFLKDGVIDSMLCAADRKENKKDACQGDSGGPLIFERDITNNKYSILGIVSSGFGCATKTPGLYTRVASYLDFIESVVWPNNVV